MCSGILWSTHRSMFQRCLLFNWLHGAESMGSCYLRTALFWVIAQRVHLISYWHFGTTYRSLLQGPRMVPKGCPETSVMNYHYPLRSNSEDRSSHLLRRGSVKSHKLFLSRSAKNSRILWKPKLHHRVRNCPPIVPALDRVNSVHARPIDTVSGLGIHILRSIPVVALFIALQTSHCVATQLHDKIAWRTQHHRHHCQWHKYRAGPPAKIPGTDDFFPPRHRYWHTLRPTRHSESSMCRRTVNLLTHLHLLPEFVKPGMAYPPFL